MTGVNSLLTNAGASAAVNITGDWVTWNGGPGDFWVWGDLGSGQVDLHAALNESAPLVVCNTKVTTATPTMSVITKFNFNHGTKIRAVVTSTTGTSSGIFAEVN